MHVRYRLRRQVAQRRLSSRERAPCFGIWSDGERQVPYGRLRLVFVLPVALLEVGGKRLIIVLCSVIVENVRAVIGARTARQEHHQRDGRGTSRSAGQSRSRLREAWLET